MKSKSQSRVLEQDITYSNQQEALVEKLTISLSYKGQSQNKSAFLQQAVI